MKALIEGKWFGDIEDTPALRMAREEERKTFFRSWVTNDGTSPFPAEPNRYHLYVSYACPWAHRTILYRKLKGLEDVISMSVLHPRWGGENGWTFGPGELSTRDHANAKDFLYEIYQMAKADFTGKVTVPVLWDKKTGTIVNNESGEIIRMFNSAFDAYADNSVDFYPASLKDEIDAMNKRVLGPICMGVYAAGFASDQTSYEAAVSRLFAALDQLDAEMGEKTYLVGEQITESDWHLFSTLVRFDAVYHSKLKCSLKRLIDYPNLCQYLRRLYDCPGVASTVRLDHVKLHYFDDLGIGNPNLIPVDAAVDFRKAA